MNSNHYRHTWLYVGLLAMLIMGLASVQSCAVQAAPLGGPKDATPPYPDSLKSTPNQQVQFDKSDIVLTFNEWVTLKNQNQIIVSPPLEHGLEAKVKGKSVVVEFDKEEVLKESTTYTINFGEAIVDYTEGNALTNYTFVFSTGDFIDSLSVSGIVTNALTGEVQENVMVSLYDQLQDSIIYQERPLYFAKTNAEGRFQINNIRQDSFRLFVLEDKNLNYFKDQESEGMGFYADTIILNDTTKFSFAIPFFVPDPALRKTSMLHNYGQLQLVFNRDPFDLNYRFEPAEPEYLESTMSVDSFLVFYRTDNDIDLILELGNNQEDTIALITFNDSLKYSKKPRIVAKNANQRTGLNVTDSVIVIFNHPIDSLNRKNITLLDSIGASVSYSVSVSPRDARKVLLHHKWKEGNPYTLILDSNAVYNHFQQTNDSIAVPFVVLSNATKGEILFELDSLIEDYQYIIQVTQGKQILEKRISGKKSAKVSYLSLNSGQYSVRIIEDRNQNGRWDPGDYNVKKQAEKWIEKKLESLKAGWTLEVSINGIEFK